MDLGNRRGVVTPRTGVVAGSVWETRMKVDEVKGGIKVFTGDENPEENGGDNSISNNNNAGLQVYKRMKPRQGLLGISGKRKTWKTESSEGSDRNPIQIARQISEMSRNWDEMSVSADGIKNSSIQIARQKSELNKNMDEQCKDLSVSTDGIKKSPTQMRKTRSEVNRALSLSVDGMERNPIQSLRTRSLSQNGCSEIGEGMEKNLIQLRKVKSESNKGSNESSDGNVSNGELGKVKSEADKTLDESSNGRVRNSLLQLRKAKSVANKVLDEPSANGLVDSPGRKSDELKRTKFESDKIVDEPRKNLNESVEEVKTIPIEKNRSDENSKEFSVCEEKATPRNLGNTSQIKSPPKLEVTDDDNEDDWEEVDEENEIESEKKSFDIKEIKIPDDQMPKKVVMEEKKNQQSNVKPVPISAIVKKQPPPVVDHSRIVPKPTKSKPISYEFQTIPKTHSKLQSLVDLVMWRDVSKSAFIFGIGTFLIISSSYTRDVNISLISVVSYLGLVYLATIFLFRSIVRRGAIDIDDASQEYVVGEEEAVWLLRLVLPYINEFLLKLRALFSGDPATTMKLAVLLFVLARCGSSITIWKMAKLGFFGIFTVPKVCSSYSTQLTEYGTFWIQRFRDAWDSCSHKKAVAFFIFTVVWNLSSIVARIWAVFMLFVAFRYYQHSLMKEEWMEEQHQAKPTATVRASVEGGKIGGHTRRQGSGPTLLEIKKQKKGS